MADDSLAWGIAWTVRRYSEAATRLLGVSLKRPPLGADFAEHLVQPYSESRVPGNLLTTAGLTAITSLITGGGGQALSHTATRIGVGDGTSFASQADTDLSAASGSAHRYFQPADTSYPNTSAGVITIQSTFGTADGNFTWNEFGCDIGTPTVTGGTTVNAVFLNHKDSLTLGTKSSGQTWVATATITLS